MKVQTSIELTDFSTKWGLVTMMNEDTSILREWMITAEEANAVTRGKGRPPGCTKEEWETGRVIVYTRPCNPGQAVKVQGGYLIVNFGRRQEGNRIVVSLMQLAPSEWELRDGVIWMDESVAAQVDVIGKE